MSEPFGIQNAYQRLTPSWRSSAASATSMWARSTRTTPSSELRASSELRPISGPAATQPRRASGLRSAVIKAGPVSLTMTRCGWCASTGVAFACGPACTGANSIIRLPLGAAAVATAARPHAAMLQPMSCFVMITSSFPPGL